MAWDIGEDVPIIVTFTDDDGALFNPTTVTFKYKNPVTETITTTTWTVSVPGVDISNLSVGKFRVHIRPTVKGFWHWMWTGAGPLVTRIVQSDEYTAIEVRPNVI